MGNACSDDANKTTVKQDNQENPDFGKSQIKQGQVNREDGEKESQPQNHESQHYQDINEKYANN